jgi:transcriptional regulator with PAS, ATPase and Fis domain
VIPIKIPPLRERKCDLFPIVDYMLGQKGRDFFISPDVKLKLLEYNWPGNVRELINVMERSLLLTEGKMIKEIIFDIDNTLKSEWRSNGYLDEVPGDWQEFKQFKSKHVKDRKQELEKVFIEKLLIQNNGNISVSSRKARIDRRQLQEMIKTLNINVSLFRKSNK